MLREWIVTLHSREDLESFYEDMETPGGNLYIPDREVEVANKRPISRNTHYMLTNEEADEVRKDPRVWGVELKEMLDMSIRPMGYSIDNGTFSKDWVGSATDVNWGLLRHTEVTNRTNWGDDVSSEVTDNLKITASGKNVDVVIVDGHIDPNHPEFAKNTDGTGGSRVVQYNWFQNDVGSGTGTYVYVPYVDGLSANRTSDNNHGCHVAGTVAGNTQGWAREANIYNISPYSTNPNGTLGSLMWDYIRAWHNTKPINPETGRRNPTITNNSYGSVIVTGENGLGLIDGITYRGVNFNPGRDLTQAELQARGVYAPSANVAGIEIPFYSTSTQADLQDAIDDGIIIVAAAGNESWKIVNPADQDYGNLFTFNDQFGFSYFAYLHRGTASGAGYAPVITVGAYGNNATEDKAFFSNCGNQVDIFAAGEAIQSSLHSNGQVADPRNASYQIGKYQGTSMASPQVAGVLALLAESWPNMSQSEAQTWLINNSAKDQMLDTGADDPMDRDSLQGAPNRLLLWINQRKESGSTFPQRNFKPRPSFGRVYPRSRLRRRG